MTTEKNFKREWCFALANQIIHGRFLEKYQHRELRACLITCVNVLYCHLRIIMYN